MATLKQVVDVLETLYPLRYAEQWDEPGLIVGDLRHDVRNIAFAADPSMAVIDQAIAGGIDLLICHHPLFFRSVHAVSGLGFRGEIVRKLNLAGCALWVGHTNADASYRGVGMAAADAFGLIEQRPLVPIEDPKAEHPVGLGRVGGCRSRSHCVISPVVWPTRCHTPNLACRCAATLTRRSHGGGIAGLGRFPVR